ncbi:hexapeptide transferase [Chryseobacterium sp. H3056]|uniref:Hexapeptide transferase n=1 Tax=Kaistella daneshvariae TaxID=2487074 RepID=A0A3N0WWT7_9FLAO|nr:NeuD/PglB/VioB family sugar acetyltransferase [Kaistella daneshvariae]ROI09231.1 hexapeptide transferase [Kaistella daneshvariae]
MLIIGSGGFAKELLQIACETGREVIFYNDFPAAPDILYDEFHVIHSLKDARTLFEKQPEFTLGLGNPRLRKMMYEKMKAEGGILTSLISQHAYIGAYGTEIAQGVNILAGTKISNGTTVGTGTMLYYNSIVTHDVKVGEFCEISPDVKLLGGCIIGDNTWLGAGSVIFPKVRIGKDVIVAAGAVVRDDVPDGTMVAGIPATVKKNL